MNRIIKLLHYLSLPVTHESKFFIVAYLWGIFSITMNWHSYLPNNIKLFIELWGDTYLICTIFFLLPNVLKTIVRTFSYLTIFITTIVDTFCFVRLDTHISSQIIQLCIETESREE